MKTGGRGMTYWRLAAGSLALGILATAGCDNSAKIAREKADAQVKRIAENLDKRTTETGVYVRVKADELKEVDPWGTAIEVSYSQGGIAEMISVRSAGPDREFHSKDDVVVETMSANFKGIGTGVKENVQETAANAAKGLVKGTFDGIKESAKELIPKRKPAEAAP